jgi:hypothetical protein
LSVHRWIGGRRSRSGLSVAVAALALFLALGAPVFGAVGPTKLESPLVTPTSGTSATVIHFEITYRNVKGTPPVYVRVAVGGGTFPMHSDGTTDWKAGVRYSVDTTLPAGTNPVRFEALDSEKFPDLLDYGSVTIDPAPSSAPTPTPTPRPSATPTSTPTAAPTATPTPTPRPSAPTPTPSQGATTSPSPTAPTGAGATASPTASASPGTTGGPTSSGDPGVSGGGLTGDGTGTTGGSTGGGASASSTGGSTGLPGADSDSASYRTETGPAPSWTTTVDGTFIGTGGTGAGGSAGGGVPGSTTAAGGGASGSSGSGSPDGSAGSGGVDSAGAAGPGAFDGVGPFSLWSRDLGSTRNGLVAFDQAMTAAAFSRGADLLGLGDGESAVLATFVWSTAAVAAWMAFLVFGKRRRDEEPPAPDAVLRAAAGRGLASAPVATDIIDDPELLMPRWRRPSLLQARKTDPSRDRLEERSNLTFAAAPSAAADGAERRRIRYAVVQLLDQPDEVMGVSIGELTKDDEVVLLEQSGLYWFVQSPDGQQGWLHRMTLAQAVTPVSRTHDDPGRGILAVRPAS